MNLLILPNSNILAYLYALAEKCESSIQSTDVYKPNYTGRLVKTKGFKEAWLLLFEMISGK